MTPKREAARVLNTLVSPASVKALHDGKIVHSDTGTTIPGINANNQQQYLYELGCSVIKGDLSADKFLVGAKAAGVPHNEGSTDMLLADVLWLLWLQVQSDGPAQQDEKAKLLELVQTLLTDGSLVNKVAFQRVAECELLAEAGFAMDPKAYHKKEIRLHTKVVYTQQKFNLLREDNEGYAKLLSALAAFGSGVAPASSAAVAYLNMRISCLIGLFELDPNRVLDLVLEAWLAFPQQSSFKQLLSNFNLDAVVDVMGFKFAHHLTEDTWTEPDALYTVCGQLIVDGTVQLGALLAHLEPPGGPDELKAAVRKGYDAIKEAVADLGRVNLNQSAEEREKERAARIASGISETDALPLRTLYAEPIRARDRRIPLLVALIRMQAWEHVKALWNHIQCMVVEVDARKKVVIEPVFFNEVARALTDAALDVLQPLYSTLYPASRWRPRAKVLPPPTAPPVNITPLALQLLRWLGHFVALDPRLFGTLAQLLAAQAEWVGLARQQEGMARSEQVLKTADELEELVGSCLLPGLAFLPDNSAQAAEVWAVLQQVHYTARFRLYAADKQRQSNDLILAASSRLASNEAKRVLRRIHVPESKDERRGVLRPYGRKLGKLALSHPIVVSMSVRDQGTAYVNMIDPLMDTVKFFSPLAFDALTFMIITELASNNKKIKSDGISLDEWLQNIAQLTGMLCKKYPVQMEMHALLQYVTNKLKLFDDLDLIVLERIITLVTGSELLKDTSRDQLDALAGGSQLQQHVFNYRESISPKASIKGATRLLTALQQCAPEERLTVPLLILLAQQQTYIELKSTPPYLKMLAEAYDRCHSSLLMYIRLLCSQDTADYAAMLPPMAVLRQEHGLDAAIIATAMRPLVRPLLTSASAPDDGWGDPGGEDGELQLDDAMDTDEPEEGEAEGGALVNGTASGAGPSTRGPVMNGGPAASRGTPSGRLPPGCLSWTEAREGFLTLLPADAWQHISPEFYIMFWTLTYADIHVPEKQYLQALRRLKEPPAAKENGEINKAEMQAQETQAKRIQEEYDAAVARHKIVMHRLVHLKERWLAQVPTRTFTSQAIIQHCVFPRVLISPEDAVYCASMLKLLHEVDVLGMHSLGCYDKVLKDLVHVIYCLTDSEANNFGLFLTEVMMLMERWRSDKRHYDAEAASKRGFGIGVSDTLVPERQSTYEQFKKINYKWQQRAMRTFTSCLLSGEYVQIRNALLVLNKVKPVYPVLNSVVDNLQQAVSTIAANESDDRRDLKLMAKSYSNFLLIEAEKPGRFLSKDDYGGMPDSSGSKAQSGVAASSKTSVRTVANGTAAAAEIKREATDVTTTNNDPGPSERPASRQANADRGAGRVKAERQTEDNGDRGTSRTRADRQTEDADRGAGRARVEKQTEDADRDRPGKRQKIAEEAAAAAQPTTLIKDRDRDGKREGAKEEKDREREKDKEKEKERLADKGRDRIADKEKEKEQDRDRTAERDREKDKKERRAEETSVVKSEGVEGSKGTSTAASPTHSSATRRDHKRARDEGKKDKKEKVKSSRRDGKEKHRDKKEQVEAPEPKTEKVQKSSTRAASAARADKDRDKPDKSSPAVDGRKDEQPGSARKKRTRGQ